MNFIFIKKLFNLAPALTKGDLAQLARAFGWQPKGQGFDSPNLHLTKNHF